GCADGAAGGGGASPARAAGAQRRGRRAGAAAAAQRGGGVVLAGWFQGARWQRWLARRIPRARAVTLDQRRIFIFPTPAGLAFLGLLALLLLVAINYQNNLAFALVFFLF